MYYFFHELKATSCPVFINGLMHDKFMSNGAEVDMNYAWHWVDEGDPAPLPEELWLITKDRSYSFDFRKKFGGYIVSCRLLSIMDKHGTAGWSRSALHVVNKKKEPVSKYDYYFLRVADNVNVALSNVINLNASDVELRKTGEIKHIKRLSLCDGIDREIFLVDEPATRSALFCSASFKAEFDAGSWQGVTLVSVSEFGVVKELYRQ